MSAHLKRKAVKKGFQFTIMVVGQSGTGKSTFVNTLCEDVVIAQRAIVDSMERTMQITPYNLELEEDGMKLNLTIIDTPGFGDAIDNSQNFDVILQYIEAQYDEVLLEETRIKRNPKFNDNRVDVCLYFITPNGHCLKEIDIEFMRKLAPRVNIIPVVARADVLTMEELKMFKQRIQEDMQFHKIPFFNFPFDPEQDDEETISDNRELQMMVPFSVVGAEDTFVVGGREVRGRKYLWGVVEVDNAQHCDFSRLRYALFTTHLQDLKDLTHDVLYENYRTLKLSQEEKKLSHSREISAENSELQHGVVKHVMIREELLKKDEEKLREMELKVQREIEAKRRELLLKEQSLRDLEQKLQSSGNESGNAQ